MLGFLRLNEFRSFPADARSTFLRERKERRGAFVFCFIGFLRGLLPGSKIKKADYSASIIRFIFSNPCWKSFPIASSMLKNNMNALNGQGVRLVNPQATHVWVSVSSATVKYA